MDELRKIVHEIMDKYVLDRLDALTEFRLREVIREIVKEEMQKGGQ